MTIYTQNVSVPLYNCARVSTLKHFVDKFKKTWFSKLTEKRKRQNQWLDILVTFITLYSYKHFLSVMRTLFINSWSHISRQWTHNNIKIINSSGYILYSLKEEYLNMFFFWKQMFQVRFLCFVHTEKRRFCIALKIQWNLNNTNLRNRQSNRFVMRKGIEVVKIKINKKTTQSKAQPRQFHQRIPPHF